MIGVSAHHRGHRIECRWFYADTHAAVADDPSRPCGHCGMASTAEGHDGCLGTLPGAMNACCGHGSAREAYVQFRGWSLRGRLAVLVQAVLRAAGCLFGGGAS